MKTLMCGAATRGVVLLCSILVVELALGESIPEKGSVDARVRVAVYRPDEVYRLHGYVGYQIDLEFERGENFVGLGAGDIEALAFTAQDNHLFLKPKAAKIATNLTVLTTRRHYQFDYSSRPMLSGGEDPDVVFALRFRYPAQADAANIAAESARSAAADLEARLGDAAQGRPNNIDYWYCGSPTIKPIAASDDGVHTRLRFAAQSELPAIFVRNDDGSESLLNFHVDAGDVIVHRVARRFILRRGRLTGCIVNQGYSGGGARLDSGTVAPSVERATQGVRHE
jgi:type IV secretion system protein VirB9